MSYFLISALETLLRDAAFNVQGGASTAMRIPRARAMKFVGFLDVSADSWKWLKQLTKAEESVELLYDVP
jgi:hypothetical protein